MQNNIGRIVPVSCDMTTRKKNSSVPEHTSQFLRIRDETNTDDRFESAQDIIELSEFIRVIKTNSPWGSLNNDANLNWKLR